MPLTLCFVRSLLQRFYCNITSLDDTATAMNASLDDIESIVPWRYCAPDRLSWQRDAVRSLGYCPFCENLDAKTIGDVGDEDCLPGCRGWPAPSYEALKVSAATGCQTCNLVLEVVSDFDLPLELEQRLRQHPDMLGLMLEGYSPHEDTVAAETTEWVRKYDFSALVSFCPVVLQMFERTGSPLGTRRLQINLVCGRVCSMTAEMYCSPSKSNY